MKRGRVAYMLLLAVAIASGCCGVPCPATNGPPCDSYLNGESICGETICFKVEHYSSGGQGPMAVTLGDYAGYGFLDIAVVNFGSHEIGIGGDILTILGNGGDGLYSWNFFAVRTLVGDAPSAVASADFDGDGHLDIVVGNQNSASLSLLLNDGTGVFETTTDVPAGGTQLSLVVADLDGRSGVDLAVANLLADRVSILLNDGMGSFTEPRGFAVGDGPNGVAAGDIDGDGDIDLVTANRDNLSILLNGADATSFVLVTLETANNLSDNPFGLGEQDVALGDLDGDGDLDLVAANTPDGRLSVYFNDGNADFAEPAILDSGGGAPGSLTLADLDGDGLIDIAVADVNDDAISVFRNTGGSAFTLDGITRIGEQLVSLVAGDLDNDTDVDLVVGSTYTNAVYVLLNETIDSSVSEN